MRSGRPACPAPMASAPGRVCQTVTLMEYVILIVVIAVLALASGGWLLFVRPRRGRAVAAPSGPPAGVSGTASASAEAADQAAGTPAPTAAVLEVERPPPWALVSRRPG